MMAGHQENLIYCEKPFASRGALPVSAQFQARRFQMPGENSANTPIEWPEVLQSELESFGFLPTAVDLTKPDGQRLGEVHERTATRSGCGRHSANVGSRPASRHGVWGRRSKAQFMRASFGRAGLVK
jgi:hypothetical protein